MEIVPVGRALIVEARIGPRTSTTSASARKRASASHRQPARPLGLHGPGRHPVAKRISDGRGGQPYFRAQIALDDTAGAAARGRRAAAGPSGFGAHHHPAPHPVRLSDRAAQRRASAEASEKNKEDKMASGFSKIFSEDAPSDTGNEYCRSPASRPRRMRIRATAGPRPKSPANISRSAGTRSIRKIRLPRNDRPAAGTIA